MPFLENYEKNTIIKNVNKTSVFLKIITTTLNGLRNITQASKAEKIFIFTIRVFAHIFRKCTNEKESA